MASNRICFKNNFKGVFGSVQISIMAKYLGIKPSEGPYLQEVARMAISAPLPSGWEEVEEEVEVEGGFQTLPFYK